MRLSRERSQGNSRKQEGRRERERGKDGRKTGGSLGLPRVNNITLRNRLPNWAIPLAERKHQSYRRYSPPSISHSRRASLPPSVRLLFRWLFKCVKKNCKLQNVCNAVQLCSYNVATKEKYYSRFLENFAAVGGYASFCMVTKCRNSAAWLECNLFLNVYNIAQ